jgi:hypothetical protein
MGTCGSGDDKNTKKKQKEKQKEGEIEINHDIKTIKEDIEGEAETKRELETRRETEREKGQVNDVNINIQNLEQNREEERGSKLRSIPKNMASIKTQYNYKLIDSSTKREFNEQINSDATLGDLFNSIKLRENGDFIIEFDNNKKIGYDKINERFGELMVEIFNNNIPEIIKMNYSYKGLDIAEDIIKGYIESNKIIGSAVLDNQELFCIITYENDMKLITPYYYKKKDNEDLEKFNLFTAFCNGKGKLYFSGGENEQGADPDKTLAKYNDFFYIDLANLKENTDKIIIQELPNLNEPRTWHSMIYVPYKYIFIVGGSNTKSVELYNMETNEITKDSELNELRSECTLCLVNNTYLYAFCGFLLYQEHITSIEKCNLLKEERKWEYVNINDKNGVNFKPSFFGISYFKNDELLLIGSNDNGDEKFCDYIYKIGKNEEEKDEIIEFKCNLTENNRLFKDKLFLPVNENESINIPLMIGEDIKLYILDTNNGEVTIINHQELNQ